MISPLLSFGIPLSRETGKVDSHMPSDTQSAHSKLLFFVVRLYDNSNPRDDNDDNDDSDRWTF